LTCHNTAFSSLHGSSTMADVVTLTMNPAIDLSSAVDQVVPVRKLRCEGLRRDPGGGGINVARVVRRLQGEVTAIYTAGGSLGQLLRSLVEREGIDDIVLPIAAETREDFTIQEKSSGQQFRFVLAGPQVSETEWQGSLRTLSALDPFPRYLVASGSLPPGVPDDFYRRLARLAHERKTKLVLDTSGAPLREALAEGVFLIKPSWSELSALAGVRLDSEDELAQACRRIVEAGQAEVVALTLGDKGALLVTHERTWRAAALPIEPISVVGAGDSFLGGMVWSLAAGHPLDRAFRYGMAAGAATVLTPGTELCHADDVHRLFEKIVLR
jgi:6-phosphofructokinase 2